MSEVEVLHSRISSLEDDLQKSKASAEETLHKTLGHQTILSEKLREAEANRESLLEQMNGSVDENSRLQAALR
ncbi:hypothetical protein H0H93_006350, partial [Arthromyces matolae]